MSTPEEREAERVAACERHSLRRKLHERQIVPTMSAADRLFGRTAAELVTFGVVVPEVREPEESPGFEETRHRRGEEGQGAPARSSACDRAHGV